MTKSTVKWVKHTSEYGLYYVSKGAINVEMATYSLNLPFFDVEISEKWRGGRIGNEYAVSPKFEKKQRAFSTLKSAQKYAEANIKHYLENGFDACLRSLASYLRVYGVFNIDATADFCISKSFSSYHIKLPKGLSPQQRSHKAKVILTRHKAAFLKHLAQSAK